MYSKVDIHTMQTAHKLGAVSLNSQLLFSVSLALEDEYVGKPCIISHVSMT